MVASKEVVKLFDALLSLEALEEPVKLDVRMPCRLVLVLAVAVDLALSAPEGANLLKKVVSAEDLAKMEETVAEMLKRGKLEGFYRKLKELGQG
jgi:hypothetical protein